MSTFWKHCPNADPVHGHVTLRPGAVCSYCGEYQPQRAVKSLPRPRESDAAGEHLVPPAAQESQ